MQYGCSLKNNRMISVPFQSKWFNLSATQVYTASTDAEEAEFKGFYEDLQHCLELIPKRWCPFHHRGLECKSRKSRVTLNNRQVWLWRGFPGGSDSEDSACNIGDLGLIPGSGRSPGEGDRYPLQYSCLKNSMDRGAWQATVHGVAKSWTQLRD